MMQDPSAGVQPPLDKHVHLISGHPYPGHPQLNLDQVLRYLIEAPSVVKQIAPMSWTYVNAPPDSTVWLEWFTQGQNGGRFPSDGYVWATPEQTYHHNINGYTIELMVQHSGFKPGFDHMTSHARTRYHLIQKAPHISAATPDANLWIVHYHHAPQQRILPTSQVQVDPYTRNMMQERGWLERQGRIERRDFMLHDREHWPSITLPGQPQQMQQQGYHGPGAMQHQAMARGGYSQAPFPQPGGPPSAKRQRVQGPGSISGPPEIAGQEFSLEDEENTAHGDYFDHLTPREISLTRYQQHHVWMEEVFQSPYAMSKILPVDLGLGLMGELKGLTEGILQPPATDEFLDKAPNTSAGSTDPASFTNLSKEQIDEFNSRVEKHIDEGKTEIERMKAEHAAKMREWRKTYKLTQAESQLRNATWQGHESALPRPTEESTTVQAAHVEDVVESVEKLVGLKVKTHIDAALVEKGGLQRIERPILDVNASLEQSKAPSVAASETVNFQQDGAIGQSTDSNDQMAGATTAEQPHAATVTQDDTAAAGTSDEARQDVQDGELDLLNDGMDIDASDLGFNLDVTNDQLIPSQAGAAATSDPPADVAPPEASQPATDSAGAPSTVNNDAQPKSDTAMFNDESNFDFGNELGGGAGEDEVGDGLIDFGVEEGMGLDDSAFGDAIHGMDS